MTWLTWRQFRTQSAVALGALLIAAAILAITGPRLLHAYIAGVALCKANRGPLTICTNPVVSKYRLLQLSGTVLAVVPGVLGIFWGAPLVARELETGTSRLAWTQSVSRTRWLAVKLSVVGLASMAAAGLFSLMVTWWSSPIDLVNANRFAAGMFGERGITPIGYAAFAFALGVTAGVLMRRTLPAMATTIVAFVAARVTMTLWVRQHLLTPTVRSLSLNAGSVGFGSSNGGPLTLFANPPNMPNAWVYSAQIVDKAGRPITSQFVASACPHLGAGGPPPGSGHTITVPGNVQKAFQDCITNVGAKFHELVTYQPASRYWTFQWYETAIFVALAVILCGFCFWRVRRTS